MKTQWFAVLLIGVFVMACGPGETLSTTGPGSGGAAGDTGGAGSGGAGSTGGIGGSGTGGTGAAQSGGTGGAGGDVVCSDGKCSDIFDGQCYVTFECGPGGKCKGVDFAPNMDDLDACTKDICSEGSWTHVSYTADEISDQSVCTTDSCSSVNGIVHVPSYTPAEIDDGNPCTTDECNPQAGITHTPIDGCMPVDACLGAADTQAIMAVDPYPVTDGCAKSALAVEPKMTNCIKNGTQLSDACVSCFDGLAYCTLVFCDCILDFNSPACKDCKAQKCNSDFSSCSGLTPS